MCEHVHERERERKREREKLQGERKSLNLHSSIMERQCNLERLRERLCERVTERERERERVRERERTRNPRTTFKIWSFLNIEHIINCVIKYHTYLKIIEGVFDDYYCVNK